MRANWICTDKEVETPLFAKRFTVRAPEKVSIDIVGLGYFFFKVNGKRVSNDLFTPAQTDYMPRDTSDINYPIFDTFTHKVFYLRYDITEYIQSGENLLEIVVGNGWFRQMERIAEGELWYSDNLCAMYDITVAEKDGEVSRICSDGSEEAYVYPILQSNLFLGETIDTRMFQAPLPKAKTMLFDGSGLGELTEQTCPSDRVIQRITPTKIAEGIYDAGENISGHVSLKVKGEAGAEITVTYSEEMEGDALALNTSGERHVGKSGRNQIQRDTYILNGEEQEVTPEFTFHCFRYFEVQGDCELISLTVNVIHTDLPVTSSFSCCDETVNWLYGAFIRSLLNNFHGCIPSDCPHRERLGYTGDGQATTLAGMMVLEAKSAYRKWIEDIFECQCKVSGHVQHTAPFMGGGGGPGGWGCAIVLVPYHYYHLYGDTEVLQAAYPKMERWLSYMENHCENSLLVREEEGGWCLGDWCAPGKVLLPEPFVNTCYLVKTLLIMAEICGILGIDGADALLQKAERYKKALFDTYCKEGSYLGGIQGADAYAVWAELPGENLAESLIAAYEEKDTFDTGFLGTEILCDVLFKVGRGDIAVKLMGSSNSEVGFGFMKQHGATTLYEKLDTTNTSHCHHMFGGCVHTLFTGLLGIRFSHGKPVVEPCLTSGLSYASGSTSVNGSPISVEITAGEVTVEAKEAVEVVIKGERHLLQGGRATYHI